MLSGPNVVSNLSPKFDGQMLYLRTAATRTQPIPQAVLVFPFSTTTVCSALRGGDSSLWLRCTRDSSASDVSGHVVVAWGPADASQIDSDGGFSNLLNRCTTLARNLIKNEDPFWRELELQYPPVDVDESSLQSLSVCTWNALNYDHYKLSDVERWLDDLKDPKVSSDLFASAVETVLLDDGWQDVDVFRDVVDGSKDRRAVRSFGVKREWLGEVVDAEGTTPSDSVDEAVAVNADVVVMGNELRNVVQRIKSKGIKRVGVWMTLEG